MYLVDICCYFLTVAVPVVSKLTFSLMSTCIHHLLVEPIKGGSSFQSVLLPVVLNQDTNSFCLGILSNIMTGYLLHTCYDEQTETVMGSTNTAEEELMHFFKSAFFVYPPVLAPSMWFVFHHFGGHKISDRRNVLLNLVANFK